MYVQDDARENELIELFQLRRPDQQSRSGTDAILSLETIDVPFELKSTTNISVTTVRDFGPDHISKWEGKHWLIGFYAGDGKTLRQCLYGSPQTMQPWIKAREAYIRPDWSLKDLVPNLITDETLTSIFGDKEAYAYSDARALHKKQLSKEEYLRSSDLAGFMFSRGAMLQLLRKRCAYLIGRGSTLNNPHINGSYFSGKTGPGTDCGPLSWKRVDMKRPADHLRELVEKAIAIEANLPSDVEQQIKTETSTLLYNLEESREAE